MSSLALTLVLLAAITHAIWNLAAKKCGGATIVFAFLTAAVAVVIWSPLVVGYLNYYPSVSPVAWGWQAWLVITASAVVHSVYFVVLLHGYRAAPLSVVYPIARGTGPLISSFAAILVFNEELTFSGVSGVLLIVCGVLLLSTGPSAGDVAALRRGLIWGGITGLTIALYTLVDAYGVKTLRMDPLLYDYGANLFRVGVLFPFIAHRRNELISVGRNHLIGILIVALLSPAAYVLVLFAMQIAPVSHVAPARELSLMFGAFFGGKFLKEGNLLRRMTAAGFIAAGVMLLA